MVTKDLRDPKVLGEYLLNKRDYAPDPKIMSLSRIADTLKMPMAFTPKYDANPSCIEKYGYPQRLPSTLPN